MKLKVVSLIFTSWSPGGTLIIPNAILQYKHMHPQMLASFLTVLTYCIMPSIYRSTIYETELFRKLKASFRWTKETVKNAVSSRERIPMRWRIRPGAFGNGLACCQHLSILVTVIVVKAYACSKIYGSEEGFLKFNQPVYYRHRHELLNETDLSCFGNQTAKSTMDDYHWATKHCGLMKESDDVFTLTRFGFVVSAIDHKQRLCVSLVSATFSAKVLVQDGTPGQPDEARDYIHPISHLKELCRKADVNCDDLSQVWTHESQVTYVYNQKANKTLSILLSNRHRPGMTSLRQASFLFTTKASTKEIAKAVMAIEMLFLVSGCYAKATSVRTNVNTRYFTFNWFLFGTTLLIEAIFYRYLTKQNVLRDDQSENIDWCGTLECLMSDVLCLVGLFSSTVIFSSSAIL